MLRHSDPDARGRELRQYRDRNDTLTNIDSAHAADHAGDSYIPRYNPQQSGGTTLRGRQSSRSTRRRSYDFSRATSDRRRYDASRRSRRGRSRSPNRRGRGFEGHELRREAAARAILSPPPKLSDPFQEVDKHHQRIRFEGSAFEKPEWQWQARRPATSKANALNNFISSIQNSRIGPFDIDGQRIRGMQKRQVDNAVPNAGLVLAHLHAKQYENYFSDDDWCMTLEEKMNLIEPGVVFKARVADSLYDRTVAIDDPSRGSHANGPMCNKLRSLIVKQRVEAEVEVLVTTGFGDREQPPRASRMEWVRLAHEDDESNPERAEGLPHIRYSGNNHENNVLSKDSIDLDLSEQHSDRTAGTHCSRRLRSRSGSDGSSHHPCISCSWSCSKSAN